VVRWKTTCCRRIRDLGVSEFFKTPILVVPAVQKFSIRHLSNTSDVGEVEFLWNADEVEPYLDFEMTDAWSGGSVMINFNDSPLPKTGTKRSFRICDWVAQEIFENCLGAPEIQLYWSLPRRDSAVQACRKFLERFGKQLEATPEDHFWTDTPVRLAFPKRNRPASTEELRSGTAIFSLPSDHERRAVDLPEFPTRARWLDYKKIQTSLKDKEFEQDGWVWQAEETLHNGKWERSYGFVGTGVIVQVPADGIELSPKD